MPWSAIDTDSRQAENKAIAERELGLVLRNWLPTILAALDQSEAMREENEKLRADLARFERDLRGRDRPAGEDVVERIARAIKQEIAAIRPRIVLGDDESMDLTPWQEGLRTGLERALAAMSRQDEGEG